MSSRMLARGSTRMRAFALVVAGLVVAGVLGAAPVSAATVPPPVVASVSPGTGAIAGGGTVTVTGSGFSHVSKVLFGVTPGTKVKVSSPGKLTVVAPRHAAGTVDVRVVVTVGTVTMTSAARPADHYAYYAPPAVTGVSPAAGALAGGVTVTVTGTGFRNVSKVLFGATPGTRVKVSSAGKLTVVAPKHAAGTADVRVYGKYGTSPVVAADRFAYLAAPGVPFVESVAATGLGALVAWAPAPAADHVRSFAVTATPAPGSPSACPARTVTATASDTQALVGGLCAGVVYTVTEKAANVAASSAASPASAPVVPLAAQVPGVPLITAVAARDGSLVISWVPPSDNGGSAVTGYTVTASAGPATVPVTAAASASSATVTGLVNGTTYTVAVTAANSVGSSPAATGSGVPQAAHAPAPPSGLTAAPDGKGHLAVSWTAPADNGGSAVTGYTVTYQQATLDAATGTWSPVSGAAVHQITVAASATQATATVFEAQKAYYLFSVTASNTAGRSAAATQAAAVTPAVTVGSKAVVLSAETIGALSGVSSAALAWNDPAPAQAASLTAGQTIIAAPGGLLPQGTLRTVTSVTDVRGTLTVATQPGQLSSAFTSLGVDASVNPAAGPAGTAPGFAPSVAGVAVVPARPNAGVGFGRSVTLSVDVKSGPFAVEGEVELTTEIDVSLDVHHGFAGIPDGVSVNATATVSQSSSLTFDVTGEKDLYLGEIDGAPVTILVGPVPVVIVPKVPVFLTLSGQGGLGVEYTTKVGASVAWTSADPTNLITRNLSTSPAFSGHAVPGLTVTGEADLGLKVQPQADIYDAAGPNVEADLDASAQVNFTPSPGDPFLSIGPKLELKAGVDLDLFSVHASLDATIGAFTFTAFTIQDPPSASYTISPAGPSVGAGGTLSLTATRSDGATAPLTWGLLGGTKSDSISSSGVLSVSDPPGRTLTVTVSDASGAAGQTTVTVGTAFDAPSAVTATQHPSDSGADISWTAPVNTGGSALAGYTVLTQPSTGTHNVGAGTTSLTLPALSPGDYAVSVYARNTAGMLSSPGSAHLTIAGAALDFAHAQVPGLQDIAEVISCPSTTFCLTVGASGGADIYRSGRWTKGPPVPVTGQPAGLSCVSATFCILTDIQEGPTETTDATVFDGTRWSAPVTIDQGASDWVVSLSCASSTICMATDYSGRAIRYSSGTWSKPQAMPLTDMAAVSCPPGSSTCIATDGFKWSRYQNGTWSAASDVPNGFGIAGLSCQAASYCVATGYNVDNSNGKWTDESLTFNGSKWSGPQVVSGEGLTNFGGYPGGYQTILDSLSCRGTTFCMAVEYSGEAFQFDGTSWRSAGHVSPNQDQSFNEVSCASARWCMATSDDDNSIASIDLAATWVAGTWSAATVFDAFLYSLSCASASFCAVTGYAGYYTDATVASVFNGSTWSMPVAVDWGTTEQGASVSCPAVNFCVLADDAGDVMSYNGTTWSAPQKIDPNASPNQAGLQKVSCPAANFCLALDSQGNAYTYQNGTWSAPTPIGAANSRAVACASPAFCVVGDGQQAITYANGTWSAPVPVPGLASIDSLACPSESFCLAGGEVGVYPGAGSAVAEFDGKSWSSLASFPALSGNLDGDEISCTSPAFCVVAASPGLQVYENGTWAEAFASGTADPDFSEAGVSCAAKDWCAVTAPYSPASPNGEMLWTG